MIYSLFSIPISFLLETLQHKCRMNALPLFLLPNLSEVEERSEVGGYTVHCLVNVCDSRCFVSQDFGQLLGDT